MAGGVVNALGGLLSKGEVYVIEANPNPWLSTGQEFCHGREEVRPLLYPNDREIVDFAMARNA